MSQSKRVVITGGASGYGKVLAFHFAREGWRVAFLDIHPQRSEETQKELLKKFPASDAFYLLGDVREQKSFDALRDAVLERWGGLDMLINNAGVAAFGALDQAVIEDWQWILDINLLSIVRSSRAFLPVLKQQRQGHLVNIASMAGLIQGPMMGSYNASKSAVVALSETMLFELERFGIKVSVACPGFFQTNLGESVKTEDPQLKARVQRLLASSKLSPEEIAAYTYKEISAGSFMILPHPFYRRLWLIKRLLPALYYPLMRRRLAANSASAKA